MSAVTLSSMTTQTSAPPVEGGSPPRSRRWTPWVVALVAVLVVGVLTGVLVSRGSDQAGSQQLSALQQACTQWRAVGSGQSTPAHWCTNMTDWMADHMGGHPDNWASPAAMRTTCQEWSASDAAGVSEGNRIVWCDDMVAWMQRHAAQWGSWSGWMMHGAMMGG